MKNGCTAHDFGVENFFQFSTHGLLQCNLNLVEKRRETSENSRFDLEIFPLHFLMPYAACKGVQNPLHPQSSFSRL